jgi:Ankyrin repeats (many copies)
MSQMPPGQDLPEDADEQYRRASARDDSRPSESTREAILAYAAKLASERAPRERTAWASAAPAAPRRGLPWRRAATFGGLAVAALAALTVLTRWLAVPFAPAAQHPSTVAADPAQSVVVTAERVAPEAKAPSPTLSAPVAARAAKERNNPMQGYAARAQAPAQAYSSVQPTVSGASTTAADVPAASPASRGGATDASAALRTAAARGDIATLQVLLASKVALNARDSQGRTALMQAVRHRHGAAVQTLLAAGADPNAADNRGTTPLAVAQAAAEPSIAELLRRYGAR